MHEAPHILEQAADGLGQALGCLIVTATGFQDSGIASHIPTWMPRPTHSHRLMRFMAIVVE